MNSKVGKVAWGSPDLKPNNSNDETKKIPFLNMAGYGKSFTGRVVSEDPLRYLCHFTTDKTGKTVKVNCTGGEDCPVFVEKPQTTCGGNYPDSRFYLKFLNRASGKIEVLDIGKQIVNGIGEYIDNPEYGHCSQYDVTINKGEKGAMPLYTVTPARSNTELTAEEKELVANSENPEHEDFIDLESRIKPLSADVVGKILGLTEKTGNVTPLKGSKSAAGSGDEEFDDIKWDDED